MKVLKALWADESGQGMVEYGLIIALVAIVVIAALGPLGNAIKSKLDSAKDSLTAP